MYFLYSRSRINRVLYKIYHFREHKQNNLVILSCYTKLFNAIMGSMSKDFMILKSREIAIYGKNNRH